MSDLNILGRDYLDYQMDRIARWRKERPGAEKKVVVVDILT
jgi:hypothetical protein